MIARIAAAPLKAKAMAGITTAAVPASFIPLGKENVTKVTASKEDQKRFDRIKALVRKRGAYAGTKHKRFSIPKEKLTEATIKQLGFRKSLISIPESGQDRFSSYRHPDNKFHIHSHKKDWTIHEDRHSSSQMLAVKANSVAGKVGAFVKGIPHAVTEGVPGGAIYAKSMGRGASMAGRVAKESSRSAVRNVRRWKDDIMDKVSVLNEIREAAFNDELEKLAY